MKTVKMEYKDLLIIDPCYIKNVKSCGEDRFDGLKCVKTLYEGDDGMYNVFIGETKVGEIGVDSGRIWALQAEFDIDVEVDSGFSGEILFKDKTSDADQVIALLRV